MGPRKVGAAGSQLPTTAATTTTNVPSTHTAAASTTNHNLAPTYPSSQAPDQTTNCKHYTTQQ